MEAYRIKWTQDKMSEFIRINIKPDISGQIDWKRFVKQYYKSVGRLYPLLDMIKTAQFIDTHTRKKVSRFISNLWKEINTKHCCKCGCGNNPIFIPHGGHPTDRIMDYTQRIFEMNVNAATKITLHKAVNYFSQIFI